MNNEITDVNLEGTTRPGDEAGSSDGRPGAQARLTGRARRGRKEKALRRARGKDRMKPTSDASGPAPAPAPGAAAWWMDPKVLLVGAAAVLILMRRKKS